MSAVLLRVRTEIRARWHGLLALALLVGVSGGVVEATAAAALRTELTV